jgi:hypothetical protein
MTSVQEHDHITLDDTATSHSKTMNTYSNPKQLQRDFSNLVNNINFADVKFIVGEEEEIFFSHKVILCQRSAYFRAMFLTSGMKESQEIISIIYKPNITPATFQSILEYIYSGIISIDNDNVYAILKAAMELQLNELAEICSKHVLQFLSIENVFSVINKAHDNLCHDISEECLSFIIRNGKQLFEKSFIERNPAFLNLPKEIIVEIVKSDRLLCDEQELFEAIVAWTSYNLEMAQPLSPDIDPVDNNGSTQEELRESIDDIMQHIRFPLMSGHFLIEVVEPSGLVNQALLTEAYRFIAAAGNKKARSSPRTFPRKPMYGSSSILTIEFKEIIQGWLPPLYSNCHSWDLIYCASQNNFNTAVYHEKCDHQKPTICLFQTTDGYLFGGFNSNEWSNEDEYSMSRDSFIFSLINAANQPPSHRLFKGEFSKITGASRWSPIFGSRDILIHLNTKSGCVNPGRFYYPFVGEHDSEEAKNYLCGSYNNFTLQEVECWRLR